MNKILYSSLISLEYAIVPGIIPPEECSQILNELTNVEFQNADSIVGKRNVKQNFSRIEFTMEQNTNSIIPLHIQNIQKFLQNSLEVNIEFNDFWFQKYLAGKEVGISPHKDSAKYVYCIAVLLLLGESNFYIYEDGDGNNPTYVHANVGDCILLRAPGIRDINTGPYHGVAGIKKERITLTLRQAVAT